MNAPAVGPHLGASAGDLEDQAEQVPAGFLDGSLAGGDAAGVEIDQVLPAPRELAAGRDLDDRRGGKTVRCAAAGGENLQRHAGGELERTADEVAGGRGCKQHAL